ncbi:MAG TPA: ROK family transcriptional regulator [Pyrinomonadaceae bacterium]|nr:ROK family transcriptional regulator [Pyrinomonadaceae bacterium]
MIKAVPLRQTFTRKPNLADVKAAGHDMLRLVNRRILLNILSDRQPISRAEIAKISGLNKATISTITGELLRDSFVIEEGSGRTTPIGGKPPTPLRLNSMRFGLFGLDIRADESILALSDFNNRLISRVSFETGSDAVVFLNKVGKEIRKLRSKHDNFIEFPGIGVSLPGLVDNHSGKFLLSVVLPWRDVPVVHLLEKATNLPVIIDNSARCSALAEIWHGKAQYAQVRDLLYVSVSTGLACGMVIDGGLYRGGNNTAGQFGHIPIDLNGAECRCGQRGCWDLYASDKATITRYLGLRGGGAKRVPTMRKLMEWVDAGDAAATEAVRETARYLGIGITGLINGLDPEVVVIGGEITKGWGLIEPIIVEETKRSLLAPRSHGVAIRRSAFEVRPSLKGALTLIQNNLLSVPHMG